MDKDMAGLFQVLYGKGDGTFRKAEVLKGTDGQPLIIPADGDQQLTEKICTRPFAVDCGELLRDVLLVQGAGQGEVPAQAGADHGRRRTAETTGRAQRSIRHRPGR